MTSEEAVAAASAKFASAEKSLSNAHAKILGMRANFKTVHINPPEDLAEGVQPFGFLEMSAYQAEAATIAGMVADVQFAVANFHRKTTARALELGIDPPVVFSGPGR